MTIVSVVGCDTYELAMVRRAVAAALAPLGGIERFVRPGMRVLLKPNLLLANGVEHAVTTHPRVVQAVAELARTAGAEEVWIGDSPGGPVAHTPQVWHGAGMVAVAEQTGARMVPFDGVMWKRLNGADYFIARPIFEADLVINLPKLKTHSLTLYTGAVKNLFGAIPGTRKRDVHCRALGLPDFSRALVDVLDLVRPGLTVLDGVVGQEGNGPGMGGTPRPYGVLAASTDGVALDALVAQALGYRTGEVLHLAQAEARGLGLADPARIELEGNRRALDLGSVRLPMARRFVRYIPSSVGRLVYQATRLRPRLAASACVGCGDCVAVCPPQAITPGHPPRFDLERCVGCMCCAEVCPQGAIEPVQSLLGRLLGLGG